MEQNEFKTHDFYHAVILKTLGFKLLRLEKSTGKFLVFVFNNRGREAQEKIQKYWDREIVVDARALIETINELKTRIHSKV